MNKSLAYGLVVAILILVGFVLNSRKSETPIQDTAPLMQPMPEQLLPPTQPQPEVKPPEEQPRIQPRPSPPPRRRQPPS